MIKQTTQKSDPQIAYIPLVQQALEALQSLSPVERAILGLRFGLDDGQERDLDEVASRYGVSSDIIRSVEIDALRKVRHHSCYKKLSSESKRKGKTGGTKTALYLVSQQ